MNQTNYRVMNTQDYQSQNKIVHEYTIVQYINTNGHEVTALYRSNDDVWSEDRRGEKIIEIIDTGNEMVFPKKEFSGDVGYDKLAELYILLAFINKTEHLPLYKATIEKIIPQQSFEI